MYSFKPCPNIEPVTIMNYNCNYKLLQCAFLIDPSTDMVKLKWTPHPHPLGVVMQNYHIKILDL